MDRNRAEEEVLQCVNTEVANSVTISVYTLGNTQR